MRGAPPRSDVEQRMTLTARGLNRRACIASEPAGVSLAW